MAKKKPRATAKRAAPKPAAQPPPTRPRKSTLAEVRRRVFEVLRLRLDGAELADICDYAAQQQPPWGLSRSQIYRYIKAADKACQRQYEAQAGRLLARHVLQRHRLFARANAEGDHASALRALDSAARLAGLFPAAKVQGELTGKSGAPLFPSLREMVEAIIAAEHAEGRGNDGDGPRPGVEAAPR
jgi:hypothetical protein